MSSELLPIWNNAQLMGAKPPPPFNFPNDGSARSIKINNQSRFWLILSKTQTSVDVDRIEPFSFLIVPYQPDLSIRIDTVDGVVSSLAADKEFVDFSTMGGVINYAKGSTQFSGNSPVTIEGNVNIGNSTIAVAITGTPTFNLSPNTAVTIANSSLSVAIQGTPTFNLSAGTQVEVSNSQLNVAIMGTPSFTIANSSIDVAITGTPTFNLAAGTQVTVANSQLNVAIQGTPTFNIGAGNAITIANSSLNVAIQGTPTFNLASGTKVDVTGSTITASITGTPSFTVANSSLNVAITGTPTFNIGAGNSITVVNSVNAQGSTIPLSIAGNVTASISNSQINVAIQGTPTFNIAAGNSITIANSSLNVAIQGTPTFNLAANTQVTIANSSLNVAIQGTPTFTVANSSLNVAIQGTPTFNLAAGTKVDVTGSTITASITGTPSFTIANSSLNVAIQGTPTMNLAAGTEVVIQSGTIEVSSANATILNEQLPTTQIYTSVNTETFNAGVTTMTFNIQFLPNGSMVELHRGALFLKSSGNHTYTVTTIQGVAAFKDGMSFTSPSHFTIEQDASTGAWMYGGQPCICNIFTITVTVPAALATADTLSFYWQVDANDTAIDVQPGYGVPVQPVGAGMLDASGTITTANTSQQIIGTDFTGRRKYLLFQNLSQTATMYINLASAASTGAGSISIPPLTGITFEASFCPTDALNVICATAGAAFTCKYS